jgi:hypothetical protein
VGGGVAVLVGELLCRIEQHNVILSCGISDGRLHYSPPGALPSELVAGLRTRKATIIRILKEGEEYRRTGRIPGKASGLRDDTGDLRQKGEIDAAGQEN